MEKGIVDGRFITIEKACSFPHEGPMNERTCPRFGNSWADFGNCTENWDYTHDDLTWQPCEKWASRGHKLMIDDCDKDLSDETGICYKAREDEVGSDGWATYFETSEYGNDDHRSDMIDFDALCLT